MKESKVAITIVGLLIALGVPALPLSEWENEFGNVWHLLGYEAMWWALVLFILLYVRFAERQPLTSIGFRTPKLGGILVGIASGIAMLAGLAAIYYVVFPALHVNEDQKMNQLMATPFWWRFISVIRAAVSEEVLFRGYAIERMRELTGSIRIASVISCVIFALEHVGPWGWGHLLIAGFAGTILTLLYLWRRNLWVSMAAHFIVDGTVVLLT
jgi:membrane protease YdiL (CAAX protease family)